MYLGEQKCEDLGGDFKVCETHFLRTMHVLSSGIIDAQFKDLSFPTKRKKKKKN